MKKILTLAIISLLLISTFSILAPQAKAESLADSTEAPNDYIPVVPEERLGNSEVLVIEDIIPWYTGYWPCNVDAIPAALDTLGKTYDLIHSDHLATIDLTAYKIVILASTQGRSTYERINANIEKINAFVSAGGIYIVHACDRGWGYPYEWSDWSGLQIMPGGVTHVTGYYSMYVHIANPASPIVAGLEDAYFAGWGYSTHGYFTNVPPGAEIVMVTETYLGSGVSDPNKPTYIVYSYGSGKVLATMQTIEWGWGGVYYWVGGYRKEFLLNEIKYAQTLAVGIRIIQPEAGKIFWIEAEPEPTMPLVIAKAEIYGAKPIIGGPEKLTIRHIVWEAICNYTAIVWTPDFTVEGKYAGYGHYEKFTFNHKLTKDLIIPADAKETTWEINWGNIICGGNLTIKVKTFIEGSEYQDSITVYIKGKNPERETIREALTDPEEPDKIALQIISYIESRFAQFFDAPWSWRTDYRPGEPLYGPPGGYGLMQIDVPPNHFWVREVLKKYDGNPQKMLEELRRYQNDLMWNWNFNIDQGKRKWKDLWVNGTLELQKSERQKYGKEVKPLSEEQKENNTACLYNTGRNYYYWDVNTKKWELTGYGIQYVNTFSEIKKKVLSGEFPEWWNWESVLNG